MGAFKKDSPWDSVDEYREYTSPHNTIRDCNRPEIDVAERPKCGQQGHRDNAPEHSGRKAAAAAIDERPDNELHGGVRHHDADESAYDSHHGFLVEDDELDDELRIWRPLSASHAEVDVLDATVDGFAPGASGRRGGVEGVPIPALRIALN